MDTKSKGKYGEELAVSYLTKNGYEILERNYRHRRGEIDIIAMHRNNLLVFVEVKLRKDIGFGQPESFVSKGQQRMVMDTAEEYIFAINWQKDIRFDIIAIHEENLEHIQDAFY